MKKLLFLASVLTHASFFQSELPQEAYFEDGEENTSLWQTVLVPLLAVSAATATGYCFHLKKELKKQIAKMKDMAPNSQLLKTQESQIQDHQNSLSNLKKTYDDLNEKYSLSLEQRDLDAATTAHLQENLTKAEETTNALYEKLKSADVMLDDTGKLNALLKNKLVEEEAIKSSLTEQLSSLGANLDFAKAEYATKNAELEKVQAAVLSLQGDNANLDKARQQAQEKFEIVAQQVKVLTNAKEDLAKQLAGANAQIESLKGQIVTLKQVKEVLPSLPIPTASLFRSAEGASANTGHRSHRHHHHHRPSSSHSPEAKSANNSPTHPQE